ncbi:hypothetical protein NDU88_002477 [Pleurodeles waltl]|uniref:Uncharacterized protein n=1 Tax=Pleurodeles waltl TaxID=8319 RepID=A0AAV7VEJ3_PLEWA|nr:hypothetical protein NDU88_002477 [Pleurodeles waltl]
MGAPSRRTGARSRSLPQGSVSVGRGVINAENKCLSSPVSPSDKQDSRAESAWAWPLLPVYLPTHWLIAQSAACSLRCLPFTRWRHSKEEDAAAPDALLRSAPTRLQGPPAIVQSAQRIRVLPLATKKRRRWCAFLATTSISCMTSPPVPLTAAAATHQAR